LAATSARDAAGANHTSQATSQATPSPTWKLADYETDDSESDVAIATASEDESDYEEEEFEVVASPQLSKNHRGLAYRSSTNNEDKVKAQTSEDHLAPWGSRVKGLRIGSNWISVGKLFLPMSLDGEHVLRAVARRGASSSELEQPSANSDKPTSSERRVATPCRSKNETAMDSAAAMPRPRGSILNTLAKGQSMSDRLQDRLQKLCGNWYDSSSAYVVSKGARGDLDVTTTRMSGNTSTTRRLIRCEKDASTGQPQIVFGWKLPYVLRELAEDRLEWLCPGKKTYRWQRQPPARCVGLLRCAGKVGRECKAAAPANALLPDGWKSAWDENSRCEYYFNCESGESTWERPKAKEERLAPMCQGEKRADQTAVTASSSSKIPRQEMAGPKEKASEQPAQRLNRFNPWRDDVLPAHEDLKSKSSQPTAVPVREEAKGKQPVTNGSVASKQPAPRGSVGKLMSSNLVPTPPPFPPTKEALRNAMIKDKGCTDAEVADDAFQPQRPLVPRPPDGPPPPWRLDQRDKQSPSKQRLRIVTYGLRYPDAADDNPADMLVDVRCFRDPGAGELKYHDGHNPEIMFRMSHHEFFVPWLHEIRDQLLGCFADREADPEEPFVVAIYCRSGQHRSVAAAVMLEFIANEVGMLCEPPEHATLEACDCPDCSWRRHGDAYDDYPDIVKEVLEYALDVWCSEEDAEWW
jgi:hypothetical protein